VWKRASVSLAVAGLVPGLLGLSSTAAGAATDNIRVPGVSGLSLRDSPVPLESGFRQFLTGSAALSPSNAWTVGWGGLADTVQSSASAVALHWDGTKWINVANPALGSAYGLNAVSGTAASDVWAVGFVNANSLVEHFNGKKWATVPSPHEGNSELNAVSALSSTDAWAVGTANFQDGLAEHWDGRQWTAVSTPHISGSLDVLTSVLDLARGNAVAVGYYEVVTDHSHLRHQLAEHWNGHVWQRVSVPQFGIGAPSSLLGVSGGTSAGVIAVGAVSGAKPNGSNPLVERWDGVRFSQITAPLTSAGGLGSVTVLSKTNAYAISDPSLGATVVEHYDGKKWTKVSTPAVFGGPSFSTIAATPTGSFVMAAGWHNPNPNERFLIEQGNGTTWKIARQ
jgi:hypothetical protein